MPMPSTLLSHLAPLCTALWLHGRHGHGLRIFRALLVASRVICRCRRPPARKTRATNSRVRRAILCFGFWWLRCALGPSLSATLTADSWPAFMLWFGLGELRNRLDHGLQLQARQRRVLAQVEAPLWPVEGEPNVLFTIFAGRHRPFTAPTLPVLITFSVRRSLMTFAKVDSRTWTPWSSLWAAPTTSSTRSPRRCRWGPNFYSYRAFPLLV